MCKEKNKIFRYTQPVYSDDGRLGCGNIEITICSEVKDITYGLMKKALLDTITIIENEILKVNVDELFVDKVEKINES